MAREVLEEALVNFPGAVVMVSHDRYFMSQVVNMILEFRPDRTITQYDCDYHDYLDYLAKEEQGLLSSSSDEEEEASEAETSEEEDSDVEIETLFDLNDHPQSGRRSLGITGKDKKKIEFSSTTSSLEIEIGGSLPLGLSIKSNNKQPIQAFQESSFSSTTSSTLFEDGSGQRQKTLKEKIESRYIQGDLKCRITKAKQVAFLEETNKGSQRSKNFGGSGVTSGKIFKGVKNAKRFV
jgi:hypothetical protein